MKSIWVKLRKEAIPSKKFSEELRAQIFEKSAEKEARFFNAYAKKIDIPKPDLVLSMEKSTSFFLRIKNFMKNFHEGLMRIGFLIGGGLMAMLFMVPLLSFFTFDQSSASEPSFIRNIEGDIFIERMGDIFSAEENMEVFNSDIIRTDKTSSAEIIFFEGTILRLVKESQIEIQKIAQHPFLFSSGGITVKLQSGKIWVKTFQISSGGSGIIVKTPSMTIYPEKSGFAAVYREGKESILMMDKSAHVTLNGLSVEDTINIDEGEMIQFTPFDQFTPLNQKIPQEWYTGWISENLEKDKGYTTEYLEKISTAMREKYVLEELSDQIKIFLKENPDPDNLEALILEINQVMLLANTPQEDTEKENLEYTIEEEPSPSPLIGNTTNTYSKPHTNTYNSRNNNTALDIQTQENKENTPIISPIPTESASPSAEDMNDSLVENINNDNDNEYNKTAVEIAQEYRLKQQQEKIESAVESFSQQVNSFEFENSRQTKAKNILKSIPVTNENLELVIQIENSAPQDVKELVILKREAIEQKIQEDLKKEKEKKIEEYKENLKNSAPENTVLFERNNSENI